jgi:hypothetical protein
MRTTKEVRDCMEAAAVASGRSLVQEVEARVMQTLEEEDHAYGGPRMAALFRMMAAAARLIEAESGRRAVDHYETGLAVHEAWRTLLADFAPLGAMSAETKALLLEPIEWPLPPAGPSVGLLSGFPDSEEYKRAMADYEPLAKEYQQALKTAEAKVAARRAHEEGPRELGKRAASAVRPVKIPLLPPSERGRR